MAEIPNNKPTDAVNWASGGAATRTEPGVAKRDQGFRKVVPCFGQLQIGGRLKRITGFCKAVFPMQSDSKTVVSLREVRFQADGLPILDDRVI